jgi:ArsR family transcriptional regulator
MIEKDIKIFKALSDPNRIRILKMLQKKSLCVCEITEILKLATSTVSNHLSILRESGLIIEEKEGKWVNYMINQKPENPVLASIISMFNFWFNDDQIIKNDENLIRKIDRNVICAK